MTVAIIPNTFTRCLKMAALFLQCLQCLMMAAIIPTMFTMFKDGRIIPTMFKDVRHYSYYVYNV